LILSAYGLDWFGPGDQPLELKCRREARPVGPRWLAGLEQCRVLRADEPHENYAQ
jgi:hypothetical protein